MNPFLELPQKQYQFISFLPFGVEADVSYTVPVFLFSLFF